MIKGSPYNLDDSETMDIIDVALVAFYFDTRLGRPVSGRRPLTLAAGPVLGERLRATATRRHEML